MTTLTDLFERAVMGFVTRASGRTAAAVAILLYLGVGLLLPLAMRWPSAGLVEANVLGTTLAGVVSVGWLLTQVEAANCRHLVEWTTDLRLLTAAEFEWLVGETFRREGWKVRETGRQDAPDGNIDLELTRDHQRKIVQCKRWESWLVAVDEIRKFEGTLLKEGLPGSAGVFVTLSDFTEQARAEARKTGVTLVDGRTLFSKVEKARRPEPCPVCKQPMLLDRSRRGWWLRCVAPECSGKRDLGIESARAVELLTEPPPSYVA